ncbi:G1 family endopeptidase [Kitasatospora kazusensis]|uniref:G1 family endopeptidase n=1 Tax=Kitasatospora kazusensis TaxID=407974 RepID=A0ABN2Z371_9ACTN
MRLSRHLALVTAAALLTVLGAAPPASAAPGHRRHHEPAQAVVNQTSANWSGYWVRGAQNQFSVVAARWTVPEATCNSNTVTFSDFWVGLDGAGTKTVEQTGTSVNCNPVGTPEYYPWYEMYPADPVVYNDPVMPGDEMQAQVRYLDDGRFELALRDWTQKWFEITYATPPSGSTAMRATAEVIAEVPGDGYRLTDFGSVLFTAARVNGEPIGDLAPDKVTMVVPGTTIPRAIPSALTGDGKDFSVAWQTY